MIAVKLWKQELAGKVVRISTDNIWAMETINKGSMHDNFMLKCLIELAWVAAQHQILIKASFIASKDNTLPDLLSRWYINNSQARRKFKQETDSTWKRRSVNDKLIRFLSSW